MSLRHLRLFPPIVPPDEPGPDIGQPGSRRRIVLVAAAITTVTTTPEHSVPRTGLRGTFHPRARRARRPMPSGTRRARTRASPDDTVVALTRTSDASASPSMHARN